MTIKEQLDELGVWEDARPPILGLYAVTDLSIAAAHNFYWHVWENVGLGIDVTTEMVIAHHKAHEDWMGMCPWLYNYQKATPPRRIKVSGEEDA